MISTARVRISCLKCRESLFLHRIQPRHTIHNTDEVPTATISPLNARGITTNPMIHFNTQISPAYNRVTAESDESAD
jgi:hypothetical protein